MRVTKDVLRKSVKFCFNSFTILSRLINRNFVVTLDQFFESAAELASRWGAERIYDWYGVGDTGLIAGQGPDLDGMHIRDWVRQWR